LNRELVECIERFNKGEIDTDTSCEIEQQIITEEINVKIGGNLKAALALHFVHYNFMRIHRSLRYTPAMAAGITGHIWK
jgi:hypothetical protein